MRHHIRSLTVTATLLIGLTAAPLPVLAQTLTPPPVAKPSTTGSSAASNSLRDILADTVDDFGRLPSFETLTILSIGGVGAAVGRAFDRPVTQSFSTSEKLGTMLHSGETIGGARTQLAGAIATYALGRIVDKPKVTAVGADLIRAQIVTQTLTAGIKMAVQRDRPDGTQYSFPSGHSSVTFATATVLQRDLGWKVGVPAYGLATFVAASRVQSKRHFLSDVAFGAALGIVAGRSVTVGKGEARFAVAPAMVPGGGAVNFTLLQKR